MNINSVEILEHASFIVASLTALAALASLVFVIASVFGFIWFKRTVKYVARKTAEDVAQQTAEDVARKTSQEAVEKAMSPENIKIMVKEAAEKAASIEGKSLYKVIKATKPVVSTEEEKTHD